MKDGYCCCCWADDCEELKVEELEIVGEGVTGPIERRDRAKSGSAASRFMANPSVSLPGRKLT